MCKSFFFKKLRLEANLTTNQHTVKFVISLPISILHDTVISFRYSNGIVVMLKKKKYLSVKDAFSNGVKW